MGSRCWPTANHDPDTPAVPSVSPATWRPPPKRDADTSISPPSDPIALLLCSSPVIHQASLSIAQTPSLSCRSALSILLAPPGPPPLPSPLHKPASCNVPQPSSCRLSLRARAPAISRTFTSTVQSHRPAAMASTVSSISQALAANAASIHIPNPLSFSSSSSSSSTTTTAGKHTSAALSASAAKPGYSHGLPTPPNSISPNLPAHSLSARARKEMAAAPPDQVDSDIELGDAVDHPGHHASTTQPPAAHGSDGAITPALIAKHYLAAIVVGKGQVAVKDVINQLAKALPGFADIPPAKARRIVVAALESRVGGVDGNVEFEKTGWGRWHGKVRGQPGGDHRAMQTIVEGHPSPPMSAVGYHSTSAALKIPGSSHASRAQRRTSYGSWAAESSISSPSEPYYHSGADVLDHDVEEMSIDGDTDQSSSRYNPLRRDSYRTPQYNYSDTDEEDWASMGAASFRDSNSYTSGGGPLRHSLAIRRRSRTKSPFTGFSRSVPTHHHARPPMAPLDFTGVEVDTQEREAIEALMRMGSM